MEVIETALPGVLLIRPRVFRDDRGTFIETWRSARYVEYGIPSGFVQDNVATSSKGVLRGLHYQYPHPQGKLVMALHGEVFDVAVDLRRGSPTFGQWVSEVLSAERAWQLWIPEGFAHGYVVLSESATVAYKATREYDPEADAAVRFDDPYLGVKWPDMGGFTVSSRDRLAPTLAATPTSRLPPFNG